MKLIRSLGLIIKGKLLGSYMLDRRVVAASGDEILPVKGNDCGGG